MTVFTLPSYNIVFKIIKDKFAPPKEVTHQTCAISIVWFRATTVLAVWRILRISIIWCFPLDRFSPCTVEELQKVAPQPLKFAVTSW